MIFINWINIVPTIIGAIVGGGITWMTTSLALKKQFMFEKNSKKINRLRIILKALYAIRREIEHNISQTKVLIKLMERESFKDEEILDLGNYNNKNSNLANISWIKFNHELIDHELNLKTSKIEKYYHDISFEINNNILNRERLKEIKKDGVECKKRLNKNIDLIKEKIDKIEGEIK